MDVADGRLALSCSSQQMMFAKVSAGSSDTDGKAKPCLPTSPYFHTLTLEDFQGI